MMGWLVQELALSNHARTSARRLEEPKHQKRGFQGFLLTINNRNLNKRVIIMETKNTTFNRPTHEEVREMFRRAKARQQ